MTLRTSSTSDAPRIRLEHVYLAAALALPAICTMVLRVFPYDFWWHLALGRQMVETGRIPEVDSFSYTQAGAAFFNQSWLAQLLMYGLYRAGGLPLMIVVQAAVIVLAYGMLLRLCLERSGQRRRLSAALLIIGTVPLSFDNWTIRPQSYTFPIFVGFLTILTEHRMGRSRRLWLLPLLMALWVNIHGAFVLGLVLIGIFFLGELIDILRGPNWRATIQNQHTSARLRELFLWGIATTAATALNPRGLGVVTYVRALLGSSQVTTLVTEWAPTTIRSLSGVIFFLFMIGWFLAMAYARKRPPLTDLILFLVFLWLGIGATRNAIWLGFVATPPFAEMLASRSAGRPAQIRAGSGPMNAMLLIVLGLLLLATSPWVKPHVLPERFAPLLGDENPVAAVEFLQSQSDRPQRLFHESGYGSYLIWAAPEQKVFIDPRIELYPYEQWKDYINLGQANNVDQLFERYQIDGALLSVDRQEPLIEALEDNPAWEERYRDKNTVYFAKRP